MVYSADEPLEGPQLLATKLHIPLHRLRLVDRRRVWDSLDATSDRSLTIVSGPAGSGKTVAVATWVRVRLASANIGWTSLEVTENDPVLFWFYVLESLGQIDSALGERTRNLVSAVAREPGTVLLPLIEDLASQSAPICLVFDDYHIIENDAIHESLNFFLDHLPPSTRIIVISRSEPPLGIAARRVRGELAELGPDELRFSIDDTADMMAGLGITLLDSQLQGLTDRTEGWAAGLYLAALSLRHHDEPASFVKDFAGTERHIIDYLATEVLERLSNDRRTFLRRTSVLSNLSAELCDAVVGVSGSQEVLEQLERSNLFLVPLDDHRRWYRYHHLFADMLAFELSREEPEIIADLHGRAGEWYRQTDEHGMAIVHLTAAGRYDNAVDLILKSSRRYFNTGRWQTVERWVHALPAAMIATEPGLALSMAWGLFSGGMLNDVLPWTARAQEGDTSQTTPWGDGLNIETEVELLRAFTLRTEGDFIGAHHAAENALALVESNPAPRRYVAYGALGIAQYWLGRRAEARANLTKAISELDQDRNRRAVAVLLCLGVMAAIEIDEGNPEQADPLCRQARELVVEQHLSGSNLASMTLLAEGRLALLAGESELAQRYLDEGLAMATSALDPGPIVSFHLAMSDLHHRQGQAGQARAKLTQASTALESTNASELIELVEQTRRKLRKPWAGASLTDRELDLLRQLPTNLSRREIAEELHVSAETIKTHSRSLFRKLGVTSRQACVERARDQGLI